MKNKSITNNKSAEDVSKKDAYTDKQLQFVLAEYSSLRSELIRRSEFRYQIISFNVLIFGTILTFGLQFNLASYVLFVFPVIAYFLAGIWAHNLRATGRLRRYIKEQIEEKFDTICWESGISSDPFFSPRWAGLISSTNGIFLGTAIIATALGLLTSRFTSLDYILTTCNVTIIWLTFMLLRSAVNSLREKIQ